MLHNFLLFLEKKEVVCWINIWRKHGKKFV